jgi:hypothetical protein
VRGVGARRRYVNGIHKKPIGQLFECRKRNAGDKIVGGKLLFHYNQDPPKQFQNSAIMTCSVFLERFARQKNRSSRQLFQGPTV